MILDYLNKYAQKAYREITPIITSPTFLFSNDPTLIRNEANHNYVYIHGFNRLIKNNRILSDKLIETFSFLERELELYLTKHYAGKKFIFYLNADILVPAFTITLTSYYDGRESDESVSLVELVDWYRENAYFDGLKIIDNEMNNGTTEFKPEETFTDSARTYVKIMNT